MTDRISNYSNLVELLKFRAANHPEQIVYNFLQDGNLEPTVLTYKELDTKARAIAAYLQSIAFKGSKALVVYPYNAALDFIAAFFGCLYAGVIAVTDTPPRHSKSIGRLKDRLVDSQASVILSTQSLLDGVKEVVPELNLFSSLATDKVSQELAIQWREIEIEPDTIAFFQYTSGSTGKPKGVMVTHANILHNCATIYQAFEHSQNTRILIWLPLFHDMGLIGGVMQPLYGNFSCYLMSPIDLIQKPWRWLEAISHHRITTSGGPNFAYDLLCLKATPEQIANLDLSCWDLAFSGAEPVRAETLEKFAKIFAPCGFRKEAFYPCYGMAEATLFISGGLKAESPIIKYVDGKALEENRIVEIADPKAKAIVGCGRIWQGYQIAIVDPDTLNKCPEGTVGEIWVMGAGIGKGYWQQSEETAKTFQAYIKNTGEGPFLRTGDFGFLDGQELYITGRLKEIMILWGRNQYPQHIERTVQKSHPSLRLNAGAAFSIEVGDEERLVIAQELERTHLKNFNLEEIVGAIRLAIAQEHLAEVYAIALLKTGTIPKTSSGKIQRRGCRALFLEGNLEAIARWQNQDNQPSDITQMASIS